MKIPLGGFRGTTSRATAIAVLAGALFLAACATASADPLAAQWHLNEVVGATPETAGTTPDSSGYGLDASAIATTIDPAGRFGSAFSFNGESQVRVSGSPTLEPAGVTVVAWVKRSDTPGPFRYIVAKGGRGCGLSSYALYTGADGGLQFYVSDGASASLSPAAAPGVWDGAWHAVAGTFDGQTVRLYVDGLQVGDGTAASAPLRYGLDSDALLIGQYPLQVQCALNSHYTGDIDEVRVYDRALSVTEVTRLQTAAGSTPPVLDPDPTAQPPANPGPSPAPAPPGQAPAALPPRVTGVASAAPIVAGRPALLTAQVQGDARRLQWDVTGDGKTDVSCDGDRTTLRFRAPAAAAARAAQFGGKVSVRAAGADGAGPAFSQSFAVAPAPRVSGSAKLNSRLERLVANAPAVYACGRASDLSAATGELTVKADTSAKYCLTRTVIAGTLSVEGCLKPIRRLEDIPPPERGIVLALARTLRYPVVPGEVKAFSQVALSFTDSYVAVGPVLINGVELTPRGDARIVIYSQVNQILSSNAAMSVGGIKLDTPRDFSLDTRAVAGGTIPLGPFPRMPSKVNGLGDFPLTGDVRVTLQPGTPSTPAGSLITTQLELPDWLTTNGERIRGQVTLRVTADGELVLEDMHIGPLDAEIGPLGVSDLKLDYTRQTQEWKGQGRLCVVIACLDAVERPGEAPPGGVLIRNGELQRAFVNVDLPTPGIALFPGVFLTRIGAGIGLDPTRFLGGARVSAFGIFQIDGTLVLALPSQAAPFRLTREESGGGFPPAFYDRSYSSFTLALGGEAFLKVPLIDGRVRLAGGFLLYEAPGYVAFGGDLDYDFFGLVQVQGRATGEMNFATGRFNLGADARACIADVICGGAITRVSSVGVGGCITVSAFGESLSVGGGVNYSPFALKFWPFDGCKWSRFDEPNVFDGRAVEAQAGGVRAIAIKRGDPSRALRLDGAGGAPRVRVTGPGGLALASSSGPGLEASKTLRIMRSEKLKATVIGLVDPEPGTYTITPLPGSPTIAKLTEANDPPDARVKASVTGKGARRKLVYDVARRPDQRVTFVESGSAGTRQIGTVRGGRGSLSFAPAPGGGRRRIQAQFELAGLPAERLTVASFMPPSARLARPGRVAVRRRGAKLLVSWARVAGATRYDVIATLASGAQRATTTRRPSATLTGITASSGGRVAVRGVASMRQGGLRTARFRATKPPARTRFGPLPPRKPTGPREKGRHVSRTDLHHPGRREAAVVSP